MTIGHTAHTERTARQPGLFTSCRPHIFFIDKDSGKRMFQIGERRWLIAE
jgi:hypothetical protein